MRSVGNFNFEHILHNDKSDYYFKGVVGIKISLKTDEGNFSRYFNNRSLSKVIKTVEDLTKHINGDDQACGVCVKYLNEAEASCKSIIKNKKLDWEKDVRDEIWGVIIKIFHHYTDTLLKH